MDGSWEYRIEFPEEFSALIIEKGSICLNGISLTAFNVSKNAFSVAVIPYTYEHTNIKQLTTDQKVNLEFDVVGKYIARQVNI
jgi:riboflavin synthase